MKTKTYLLASTLTLAGALITAPVTAGDLRPNAAPSSADFHALGKMPLPIAAMTAGELEAVRGTGVSALIGLLTALGPVGVVNALVTDPSGTINTVVTTLLTPPLLP